MNKQILIDIIQNVGIIFLVTFFIRKLYSNKNKKIQIEGEGKFFVLKVDKSLFWMGIAGVILMTFILCGWTLSGQLRDDIKENGVKFGVTLLILFDLLFVWLACFSKFHKIKYNQDKVISYGIFKVKTIEWKEVLETRFRMGGEIMMIDNCGNSVAVGSMLIGFNKFLNDANDHLSHLESWPKTLEKMQNHKI